MDSEPGYVISQASAAPSVPWGRVLVLLAQNAGQLLPAKAPLLPSQSFPHMAAKVVISKPDLIRSPHYYAASNNPLASVAFRIKPNHLKHSLRGPVRSGLPCDPPPCIPHCLHSSCLSLARVPSASAHTVPSAWVSLSSALPQSASAQSQLPQGACLTGKAHPVATTHSFTSPSLRLLRAVVIL